MMTDKKVKFLFLGVIAYVIPALANAAPNSAKTLDCRFRNMNGTREERKSTKLRKVGDISPRFEAFLNFSSGDFEVTAWAKQPFDDQDQLAESVAISAGNFKKSGVEFVAGNAPQLASLLDDVPLKITVLTLHDHAGPPENSMTAICELIK